MTDASVTMIDSVFMAKLIASELYGDPKEGLADRLKERAPRGLTEAGLMAAAEFIIRNRGAGSFPTFPDCMSAIERHQNQAAVTGQAATGGPVDKLNYADRAIQFCRRAGLAANRCPIITKLDHPGQWLTWQAYFKSIQMPGMASHMHSAQQMTVPAPWPWDFDLYSPVVSEVKPDPTPTRNMPSQMRRAA
jgi:hypothetical protein